jgi:hypothetical protein
MTRANADLRRRPRSGTGGNNGGWLRGLVKHQHDILLKPDITNARYEAQALNTMPTMANNNIGFTPFRRIPSKLIIPEIKLLTQIHLDILQNF